MNKTKAVNDFYNRPLEGYEKEVMEIIKGSKRSLEQYSPEVQADVVRIRYNLSDKTYLYHLNNG